MNRLNVQQTGGFPLTTNTLNFMQASLLLMQNFGEIAGDLTILSGCKVTGSQVSDGTVYIGGEILPFVGGTLATNVVIVETRTQKQFEDGVARDVEVVRKAQFGNGTTVYPWANFTRITPIKILQKALTPVGLISMWSGEISEIPAGWVLCNGENGTPDLSGKFVRGYSEGEHRTDENAGMGAKGGSDSVTLQSVNLPPHSHDFTASGSHSHSFKDAYYIEKSGDKKAVSGTQYVGESLLGSAKSDEDNRYVYYRNSKTDSEFIRLTGVTQRAGGLNGEAQPIDNRPAYYTLAFIMFKGI